MRRALKHHQQLSIPVYARTLDKNGQLRGARKGDKKRVGVGRPRSGPRASERHTTRPALRASQPVHVILRAHADVKSLRTPAMLHAIREALITLAKHEDSFRVIQFSLQRQHIHLLVEARDRSALWRGMQAFGISAAKHINRLLVGADGARRRGSVFPDRYHAVILKSRRQVRNVISYVLNNWRHHDEDRGRSWHLDPFSSAVTFEGWKERAHRDGERFLQPPTYVSPLVWAPKTWLLTTGWRHHGLISAYERPGGGSE